MNNPCLFYSPHSLPDQKPNHTLLLLHQECSTQLTGVTVCSVLTPLTRTMSADTGTPSCFTSAANPGVETRSMDLLWASYQNSEYWERTAEPPPCGHAMHDRS